MCEKSVKRLASVLFLCVLVGGTAVAEAAQALVVGAVRDRAGTPVAGASITFLDRNGAAIGMATTAEDGTFAQAAPGAATVRIACSYCRPVVQGVSGGDPVIAIVQRFDALLQDGPSAQDADALPYGHVESVLSLRPYTVLADSSGLLAGPVISDRGLSRAGGLVVDGGIANYDFAADASPFLTVPSRALTEFDASGAGSAFRYGDRADAGTFTIAPSRESDALLGGGDDAIGRTQFGGASTDMNLAFSGNKIEQRQRADAQLSFPVGEGSIDATVLASRGTLAPFGDYLLDASFDGARVSAQVTRAQRRYADLWVDHGTYVTQRSGAAVGAQWSDIAMHAGIQTLGATSAFLEAGARRSNGVYDAEPRIDKISGGLNQLQISAGVQSHTASADLLAGFSVFDVAYSGGPTDPEYASSTRGVGAQVVEPSLDYTYHPAQQWSVQIVTASTFRLPTLLERYAHPPASDVLALDRNALLQTTLAYTDLSRMRASMTVYRQDTNGLDTGGVSGFGGALAWQVSPQLSVRSWLLRETDTTAPVSGVARLTPADIDAVVGSGWLTYESPAFRIDAIYRRDLLDTIAYSHFDYAVSAPLGGHARWFAGSEVRHRQRYLDFGIRFVH